jgi:nicotinamidase-related amidase
MQQNRVPAWAVERGKAMHNFRAITPETTALLVIDMQNYFIAPDQGLANQHTLDTIPHINYLAQTLRRSGGRVFWSRHTVVDNGPGKLPPWLTESGPHADSMQPLRAGASGHGIFSDLFVDASDIVFDKYRYSAFVNGALDLNQTLRQMNIDTVIVTGTVTNCCCETTARDAMVRDYRVFFIHDATSAVTQEEHDAALLNIQIAFGDIRSTAEIIELIESHEAG